MQSSSTRRALLLLAVVLASALLLRAEAPARSTFKPRHESEMTETEMDEPLIPTFDDTEATAAEEEPAQTDADSDKRSYMRFGRSYMRFGRSAVAARFSDNAGVEADKRSGMAAPADSNSKRSYMRFGKRSYMRFGK